MKRAKRTKRIAIIVAILLIITALAAMVSPDVRNWLYEAFCYVACSAIALAVIVIFIILPIADNDKPDRSQDTIDWEMEQDRLRRIEEEEEWLNSHR